MHNALFFLVTEFIRALSAYGQGDWSVVSVCVPGVETRRWRANIVDPIGGLHDSGEGETQEEAEARACINFSTKWQAYGPGSWRRGNEPLWMRHGNELAKQLEVSQ